jgi:hypothetical protein
LRCTQTGGLRIYFYFYFYFFLCLCIDKALKQVDEIGKYMVNRLLIIYGYMNSLDIVNISYGVSVCIGILIFAQSKMLDIQKRLDVR